MSKKNLVKLIESNIERAEIVLAVKGEIVDKLQRFSEQISNQRIDILGPLIDRIKAEQGVEAADKFRTVISAHLEHAERTLMDVKDKISTETLKLTGDIASAPDVASISDEEVDIDSPSFDMESDAGLDELDITADITEPTPEERPMKESRKLGLVIESVKGTVGKKYFSSKTEMNDWLNENKSKIKTIVKVLK